MNKLYRIGIIGTENSHALAFTKILKAQYGAGARVCCVYGPDEEATRKVIEAADDGCVDINPSEFAGKVDAVMITSRKGSEHLEYAMPFIKQGVPLFIDKPFTSDVNEAFELIKAARESKCLIIGGSGCKHLDSVQKQKDAAKALMKKGELLSGSLNFSVQADSTYDGFFFYSPHLVEMCIEIFGRDIKSVVATEKKGTIVAICRYSDYDVTLHFTNRSKQSFCVIYGKEEVYPRAITLENLYDNEVAKFVDMLERAEIPQSYEELSLPVQVIAAIEKAFKTGAEVLI